MRSHVGLVTRSQSHQVNFSFRLLMALCQFVLLVNSIGLFAQNREDNKPIKFKVSEGTNLAIALSPDGKWIACDLQGTIYILSATGGPATALTDGMGDERQPSWSADGKYIVFQSYRDGNYHLWRINKDGSALTQITFGLFDDREPQMSNDGDRILFSSDRSGNYDIWELRLSTGGLTQLTTDAANEYHPALSYDGKQLAYISSRQNGGLFLRNEQGQERLLVPLKGTFNAPSWSPDGKLISFNAYAQAKSQMMVTNVETGVVQPLSIDGEDVFPFRACWISDKELIYSADGRINRKVLSQKSAMTVNFSAELSVIHPSYPKKKRDFNSKDSRRVLGIFGPVVSPDGKSTAFTALGDIWVVTHGNANPVRITHDAALDIDVSWSPDGKKIAFASDRAGGSMNIWIRDLVSFSETQITNFDRHALQPSFSPDGTRIAFLLNDGVMGFGTSTLQVLDLATGAAKPYHKPLFTAGKPTWSADGKLIALSALQPYSTRYREGLSKVLLVPMSGEAARFFSPVEGRSLGQRGKNGPVWSPDGHSIAYVQDGQLWVLKVSLSGQPVGPPVRYSSELVESPSWTGDSQSIVFIATDHLRKVDLKDGSAEVIPLSLEWSPEKNQETTVIHAGQVFDGRSSSYLKNMDIIVEGNRIKEIVPHVSGRSIKVIDASDKTVMPGLFEMHTHQNGSGGEKLGRTWLAYGITSVRETGGDPYDALERKESWGSGARIGPRIFFTGPLMDGERVYYELATSMSSGAQLEMELDRAARLDYDFIKTYVRFPDAWQKRATIFAHAQGIPVSSHEIYPATAYGVDAVEHIAATSRRGYSPKLSSTGRNYDDVVQLLARSGMTMTPTISLFGGFNLMWMGSSDLKSNRQLNALYSKSYIEGATASANNMMTANPDLKERFAEIKRAMKKLFDAGVRITPGTDSPFITYGLSLQVELQCFVEAGFTPFQALQAATLQSAEAIGVGDDLGTIEAGKLADIIIVNGDPLKNIKDALNVEVVIKNGIVYPIETLLKPR